MSKFTSRIDTFIPHKLGFQFRRFRESQDTLYSEPGTLQAFQKDDEFSAGYFLPSEFGLGEAATARALKIMASPETFIHYGELEDGMQQLMVLAEGATIVKYKKSPTTTRVYGVSR